MSTFVSVMLRILDGFGIKYGDDIVKVITPLGYQGTAEYYRGLGISSPTTELVELMNKYVQDEYAYKIPAKESVVETLTNLKKRGDSLNVLTANPHIMLDPCLKRLGIWNLFDNIWSCDDFKTSKADPKIYQLTAEKIGRDIGEIIFVDDNVNAVKIAKIAGMKSYVIYDASSAAYEDETKAVSDRCIEHPETLLYI